MAANGTLIVVGVGVDTGPAICRRFAREGYAVAMVSRHPERLSGLAGELGTAKAYAADATDGAALAHAFNAAERDLGSISVAIANTAHPLLVTPVADLDSSAFETMWRTLTLAAMHTGREAAKRMAPRGSGSIMFTGGRASRRGDAGFAAYAVAQFGIRGLAETLSRELAPKGIHVAHLIVEGTIAKEAARTARPEQFQSGGMVDPDSLAEIYWQTHAQPRSCWTFEVDVRPWSEPLFGEWRRPGQRS